jgi:heme-degrading monooxygenase HmoA
MGEVRNAALSILAVASTPTHAGLKGPPVICRMWRGWTTRANADAYESVVRGEVIPGIEAMRITGFRHIDLMRRELEDEVEFVTLMWFDDVDSVKAFVGEDYEVSHVPPAARAVLARHDERSAHYQVLDRRSQPRVSGP